MQIADRLFRLLLDILDQPICKVKEKIEFFFNIVKPKIKGIVLAYIRRI